MLKPQDKAPRFAALDAALAAGKGVVLYFYPRDMTPGCTAEACSLRDEFAPITSLGYVVIGVSKDSEASHERFRSQYDLPFELIADTDHSICEAYGMWVPKTFRGNEFMGVRRYTFLISKTGIIEKVIGKVDIKQHGLQVIQAHQAMLANKERLANEVILYDVKKR